MNLSFPNAADVRAVVDFAVIHSFRPFVSQGRGFRPSS